MGFFKNPLQIKKKVASAVNKLAKPSAVANNVGKSFQPGMKKFQGGGKSAPAAATQPAMRGGGMRGPGMGAGMGAREGRMGQGMGPGMEPRMAEGGKVKPKKK